MTINVNGEDASQVLVPGDVAGSLKGAEQVVSNGTMVFARNDADDSYDVISVRYNGDIAAGARYASDPSMFNHQLQKLTGEDAIVFDSIALWKQNGYAGIVSAHQDPNDDTVVVVRYYSMNGYLLHSTPLTVPAVTTRQIGIAHSGVNGVLVSLENAETTPVLSAYHFTTPETGFQFGTREVLSIGVDDPGADIPFSQAILGAPHTHLDRLVALSNNTLSIGYRNIVTAYAFDSLAVTKFTYTASVVNAAPHGVRYVSLIDGQIVVGAEGRDNANPTDEHRSFAVYTTALGVVSYYDSTTGSTGIKVAGITDDDDYFYITGESGSSGFEQPLLAVIAKADTGQLRWTDIDRLDASNKFDFTTATRKSGGSPQTLDTDNFLVSIGYPFGPVGTPNVIATTLNDTVSVYYTQSRPDFIYLGGPAAIVDVSTDVAFIDTMPSFGNQTGDIEATADTVTFDLGSNGDTINVSVGYDPNQGFGNITAATGSPAISVLTLNYNTVGGGGGSIVVEFGNALPKGIVGLHIKNNVSGLSAWWRLTDFTLTPKGPGGTGWKYQYSFLFLGPAGLFPISDLLSQANVGDSITARLVTTDPSWTQPSMVSIVPGTKSGLTSPSQKASALYGFFRERVDVGYAPKSLDGFGSIGTSIFKKRPVLAFYTDDTLDGSDQPVKRTYLALEGEGSVEVESIKVSYPNASEVNLDFKDALTLQGARSFNLNLLGDVIENRDVKVYYWDDTEVFNASNVGENITISY